MSPHAMTSLVSDLVEMAKAVELLPQVQAELDRARETIDHRGQHIEQLELKAHAYKQEIETLHSTIRSLEVARDDAELRFLELDEHASAVTRSLGDMQAALGQAVVLLSPPKPQPEPEPINPHANEPPLPVSPALHVEDQKPSVGSEEWSRQYNAETETMKAFSEGQSEPDPLPQPPISNTSEGYTVEHGGTGTIESEHGNSAQSSEPPSGPYYGKRYIDIPGWVSRDEWLAGGGTQYDYDWRYGQDYLPV